MTTTTTRTKSTSINPGSHASPIHNLDDSSKKNSTSPSTTLSKSQQVRSSIPTPATHPLLKEDLSSSSSSSIKNTTQMDSSSLLNSNLNQTQLYHAYTLLLGHIATIRTMSGDSFEGVLHTIVPEQGVMVLKATSQIDFSKSTHSGFKLKSNGTTLVLPLSQLAMLHVKNIGETQSKNNKKSFQTDKNISGTQVVKERTLEKWVPDQDSALFSTSLDFDPSSNTAWNQFDVNNEKFGVTSTYHEEIYTTKLDRESELYKLHEKEAIRLAKEIEQGDSSNIHILEERNQDGLISSLDEEDRYGAVLRSQKNTNKQTNLDHRRMHHPTMGSSTKQTSGLPPSTSSLGSSNAPFANPNKSHPQVLSSPSPPPAPPPPPPPTPPTTTASPLLPPSSSSSNVPTLLNASGDPYTSSKIHSQTPNSRGSLSQFHSASQMTLPVAPSLLRQQQHHHHYHQHQQYHHHQQQHQPQLPPVHPYFCHPSQRPPFQGITPNYYPIQTPKPMLLLATEEYRKMLLNKRNQLDVKDDDKNRPEQFSPKSFAKEVAQMPSFLMLPKSSPFSHYRSDLMDKGNFGDFSTKDLIRMNTVESLKEFHKQFKLPSKQQMSTTLKSSTASKSQYPLENINFGVFPEASVQPSGGSSFHRKNMTPSTSITSPTTLKPSSSMSTPHASASTHTVVASSHSHDPPPPMHSDRSTKPASSSQLKDLHHPIHKEFHPSSSSTSSSALSTAPVQSSSTFSTGAPQLHRGKHVSTSSSQGTSSSNHMPFNTHPASPMPHMSTKPQTSPSTSFTSPSVPPTTATLSSSSNSTLDASPTKKNTSSLTSTSSTSTSVLRETKSQDGSSNLTHSSATTASSATSSRSFSEKKGNNPYSSSTTYIPSSTSTTPSSASFSNSTSTLSSVPPSSSTSSSSNFFLNVDAPVFVPSGSALPMEIKKVTTGFFAGKQLNMDHISVKHQFKCPSPIPVNNTANTHSKDWSLGQPGKSYKAMAQLYPHSHSHSQSHPHSNPHPNPHSQPQPHSYPYSHSQPHLHLQSQPPPPPPLPPSTHAYQHNPPLHPVYYYNRPPANSQVPPPPLPLPPTYLPVPLYPPTSMVPGPYPVTTPIMNYDTRPPPPHPHHHPHHPHPHPPPPPPPPPHSYYPNHHHPSAYMPPAPPPPPPPTAYSTTSSNMYMTSMPPPPPPLSTSSNTSHPTLPASLSNQTSSVINLHPTGSSMNTSPTNHLENS